MNLNSKAFQDLSLIELYEILSLRCEVFVVEQKCAYQDIDSLDLDALHLFYKRGDKIVAYLRILKPGSVHQDSYTIGRVVSRVRREKLATELLRESIKLIKQLQNSGKIRLSGQTYAKKLYENLGFRVVSDVYLEDGIEHVDMILEY